MEAREMVRRLTIWIASLTVAMLMMAIVLAGAAHAGTERRGTSAMEKEIPRQADYLQASPPETFGRRR